MQDIKFRGISIKTGLMVIGGGIDTQRDTPVIINQGERHRVKRETIGQFIGLKDDLKVDVYTADLVNISGSGLCIVEICPLNGVVYKSLSGNGFDTNAHDVAAENDSIVIVCNIHLNPELLKNNK